MLFSSIFQYRLQMTQETMGLIWGIFSGDGEQDRWNNWEFVDMIQDTGLLLTILRQKINELSLNFQQILDIIQGAIGNSLGFTI